MGMNECYSIRIEVLENGFSVTVPDMDSRAEKKAEAKRKKMGEPYLGDCTKTYAAKSQTEVMKYVRAALDNMPDEFGESFAEATKET